MGLSFVVWDWREKLTAFESGSEGGLSGGIQAHDEDAQLEGLPLGFAPLGQVAQQTEHAALLLS